MTRFTDMPLRLPYRILGIIVLASMLTVVFSPVIAQTEDSDCLYEFNKAFALNESGMQQIETAQKHVGENNYQSAREYYAHAIDLLQQSYDDYTTLSTRALDCSPTNLSIAKNNALLTKENLDWAKSSINGLECLKAINELESISNLASEYYYEHNDPNSAKRTANDALALAEQIKRDAICQGEYRELLIEQQKFAQNIFDALANRSDYDRCIALIKSAASEEEIARKAEIENNRAASRVHWQKTHKLANEGINAGVCEGLYLKRLQNMKAFAGRQLDN